MSDVSLPERLADAEGELPEEIAAAIGKTTRIAAAFAPAHWSDRVPIGSAYDAALKDLTATILARLTAAESAREAAASERDAFRDKLAETCGRLMVAEGSASKLRAEREHTDLRIRAQRARLRELEPCVGGAVTTDGRARLLQFARKKASECRSLRRAGDAALARAERAEAAMEPLWQRARAPGADRVPDDATVTVFMKDCREALATLAHPEPAVEPKS